MNKLSPRIRYNCKSCNFGLEDDNVIPTIILSKPKEKTTTKITTFYPKKYTKNTNSLF